jgi:hypothetical protein
MQSPPPRRVPERGIIAGNVIAEGTVEHVYLIEQGLIKSMEIRTE